jgi:hypothetical protein
MIDIHNMSHRFSLPWSEMTAANFIHREKALLLLWLVANLVIGALTVHQHGMSIDEPNNYRYAADTLDAYPSLFGTLYEPKYNSSYDGHGPAFVTIVSILIRIIQSVVPNVFTTDLWHFSYFITFQLSGLCLYWLIKRWFNNWTAWGILSLFITQPILWGHAFINPKDIPFMAFFLASIATGFAMVDGISRQASYAEIGMGNSAPTNHASRTLWRPFISQVSGGFANPSVWFAGIVLGLTSSIRILGPYAGAIVVLYALFRSPRRTPGILLVYFLIAVITCFLTWPFLWVDPFARFLHGFNVASEFPWQGSVLFEKKVIEATELPARYLPKMMSIQFTETAIILFITGAMLATWKLFKEKILVPFALILIWLLIPLSAIILSRSVVYDGFRQIFFLIPPLFICAGFAFDWIFDKLKTVSLRLLALVLMVAPGIFSIITLHPYEYIYYNSIVGGVQGAYEKYELDYWATSYREVALFVNEIAPPNAHVVIFGPVDVYAPYSRPDIELNSQKEARILKEHENIVFDYVVMLNRRKVIRYRCEDVETIKTVERGDAVLVVVKKIPLGQNDCP